MPSPAIYWAFHRAHAAASRARDDATRQPLLEQAAELYTGELLVGLDDEWAVPAREAVRRQAADALARRARLTDDPDEALVWFERLLVIEPNIEETYCEIMKLPAKLGRPEAVRRTFQRLEAAMGALDCELEGASYELLRRLLISVTEAEPSARR